MITKLSGQVCYRLLLATTKKKKKKRKKKTGKAMKLMRSYNVMIITIKITDVQFALTDAPATKFRL